MKTILIVLTATFVLALGSAPAPAQGRSDKSKEFSRQWREVKQKYPLVAMEYLRREAFIGQAAQLTIGEAVSARQFCYIAERLRIYVRECRTIDDKVVIGDIGSCFEPKPSANGGYEMPDVEDAGDCVQEERRPRPR